MRVVMVLGSPRPHGNTARVLDWMDETLSEGGHDVIRLRLPSKVPGCMGCWKCKESLETRCVLRDEVSEAIEQMVLADVSVLGTPVYCWAPSAQMKCLIDRCVSLVTGYETPDHASRLAGKGLALVATAEGGVEGNLDLLQAPFRRRCDYLLARNVGELLIPDCTEPENLGAGVESRVVAFAHTFGR